MKCHRITLTLLLPVLAGAAWLAWPARAQGTQPDASSQHAQHQQHAQAQGPTTGQGQPSTKDLIEQIAALRAEVAKLQAALVQGHGPRPGAPPQMGPTPAFRGTQNMPMGMRQQTGMGGTGSMQPPPGGMGIKGTMTGGGTPGMPGVSGGPGGGMMDTGMMAGEMGGGPGGMPGMSMMDRMMSMGMARMGGGMAGAVPSALPGFPGASHIYHIGASGFFLDHSEHITLSIEQERRLNQVKETALMEQATIQRRIEQAEQDLWLLTGSDAPDAAKIDAKVREIEKLRGDQRIAFIRAVGNTAAVLTDEQRKQLTGMLPPDPTQPDQPMQPQGPGMGGMNDM